MASSIPGHESVFLSDKTYSSRQLIALSFFQPNPWLHVAVLVSASHEALLALLIPDRGQMTTCQCQTNAVGLWFKPCQQFCVCVQFLAHKDVYCCLAVWIYLLCYLIFCSMCLQHRGYIKTQYVILTRSNFHIFLIKSNHYKNIISLKFRKYKIIHNPSNLTPPVSTLKYFLLIFFLLHHVPLVQFVS